MEDLNPGNAAGDTGGANVESLDPTDDLAKIIRVLVARRDAVHEQVDPDEIIIEIESLHTSALLSRGKALARQQCRRMVTNHLRRISALDPEDDGPQVALPGLERLPSHISFEVETRAEPNGKVAKKIVAMNIHDATRAQHLACLLLKKTNTQRCLAREAQQERIIDLLDSTGCDSLREWELGHGQSAA